MVCMPIHYLLVSFTGIFARALAEECKVTQVVSCLPDVAWGSLVGAGVTYRSRLVFIVYYLPDTRLYEQL